MNNLTIAIPGDAGVAAGDDAVMNRLRGAPGLRPDMLTVDFSAVQIADAAWLAMLHMALLDVEDGGALVLLDGIRTTLAPMLEATGMHTAFFCRYLPTRT